MDGSSSATSRRDPSPNRVLVAVPQHPMIPYDGRQGNRPRPATVCPTVEEFGRQAREGGSYGSGSRTTPYDAYHPRMAWPAHEPPRRPPYPSPQGWRPMPPVPMPPPPAVEPQGVVWSVVPLLTLGFGAPFSFGYAANKSRSWKLAAAGA